MTAIVLQEERASGPYEVRPYQPGDEERIVHFLDRYMGWPAAQIDRSKLDHWKWKFLSNPMGFNLVCLAENAGRVVSHCASLPAKMLVGGREVSASQGVDLCTHPEHRGQGLIGQVMDCRNRLKDRHGINLDFGFPNRAAYHVSLMKQGFRELDMEMVQHQFIIDGGEFFRKVRFGPLKRIGYATLVQLRRSLGKGADIGEDLVLTRSEYINEQADRLYEKAAEDFDLIARRDSRFLNWRFSDPRSGGFVLRTVWSGSELLGYAAHKAEIRESTRYLNIVDMLADPDRPDVLTALALDALAYSRSIGSETVLCCLPQDHPYGRALADLGFVAKPRMTGDMPMRMIWSDRGGADASVLATPSPRCHITLGDTDWV